MMVAEAVGIMPIELLRAEQLLRLAGLPTAVPLEQCAYATQFFQALMMASWSQSYSFETVSSICFWSRGLWC